MQSSGAGTFEIKVSIPETASLLEVLEAWTVVDPMNLTATDTLVAALIVDINTFGVN